MDDEFIYGFTFASLIYFFIYYFVINSNPELSFIEAFHSCKDNGFYMFDVYIMTCRIYIFK